MFHVYGQEGMKQYIWPIATKDTLFFTGMLLMSSVHIDGMGMGRLAPVTTALKLEVMRLVRERIQQPTPDAIINCIAAVACLATCALVRDAGMPRPFEYCPKHIQPWLAPSIGRFLTVCRYEVRWKVLTNMLCIATPTLFLSRKQSE